MFGIRDLKRAQAQPPLAGRPVLGGDAAMLADHRSDPTLIALLYSIHDSTHSIPSPARPTSGLGNHDLGMSRADALACVSDSQAFFIFNQKGEVSGPRASWRRATNLRPGAHLPPLPRRLEVCRRCQVEAPLTPRRSIADVFRIQVISNPDIRSPIITLGSTSFFHVRLNNIFVVGVTK